MHLVLFKVHTIIFSVDLVDLSVVPGLLTYDFSLPRRRTLTVAVFSHNFHKSLSTRTITRNKDDNYNNRTNTETEHEVFSNMPLSAITFLFQLRSIVVVVLMVGLSKEKKQIKKEKQNTGKG